MCGGDYIGMSETMKVRFTGVSADGETKVIRTVTVKPDTTEQQLKELGKIFVTLGQEVHIASIVMIQQKKVA